MSSVSVNRAPDAWLHHVVSGDGEADLALSFSENSFPFDSVLGFRSIKAQPLFLEAPPFVLTDEVLETAWKAATLACVSGPNYKYVAPVTPEQWFTALRAGIEAAMGGGA